ncbi:MAG: ABC transporter substrate-binding protein [Acidimicrobiales bacterium]
MSAPIRHLPVRPRARWLSFVGVMALAALLLASCSSSSSSGSTTTTSRSSTTPANGGSSAPGVTATEIKVGSISTLTGFIAADFNGFAPGMQAYFDMVNAQGGVGGRKVVLAYNLDDGGSPTTFNQLAHTLIEQDHVFAVGASTAFFSPNLFVQTGTPTYGYNVTGNWQGPANLFAAGGSVQNYQTGASAVAYLMKQVKSTSVAFFSYGSAIAASYDACHADAANLQAAGIKVSYTDLNASPYGNYTSAVQHLPQTGALVVSCMQGSDNVTLAREIQQYGLKVHQLWFNGYDQSLVAPYSSLLQGVYINIAGNVPFEAQAAYPGHYPGMANYLAMMKKYEPAFTTNGVAFQGWQSAALLVDGIKAAGSDLTQQNVISKTNQIANFTAGGLTTVTHWQDAHNATTYPTCSAFVAVKGKSFVLAVAKGPQTFVCFARNANLAHPSLVTPPAGTPGT